MCLSDMFWVRVTQQRRNLIQCQRISIVGKGAGLTYAKSGSILAPNMFYKTLPGVIHV